MHLFCFGLGYVTQILIKQLSSQWKISGSHTGKRALKKNEYLFNSEAKFQIDVLDDVTHILISIPPTNEGDTVFLEFEEYIKKLPKLKWVGYFSSTSVYGDHQGEWVNELSETRANDGLGKNRLIAEKQWLESGLPINIFRLASIYGEGRSALEAIKSGRATRIFKENHCFSRIHVKDLAKIVAKVPNGANTKATDISRRISLCFSFICMSIVNTNIVITFNIYNI